MRLPDGVHKVEIRTRGNGRVIAPVGQMRDSFLPGGNRSDASLTTRHNHRHRCVDDLHIAGHARSEGLVLVTNNMSEFVRVPALELENWVQSDQQGVG